MGKSALLFTRGDAPVYGLLHCCSLQPWACPTALLFRAEPRQALPPGDRPRVPEPAGRCVGTLERGMLLVCYATLFSASP